MIRSNKQLLLPASPAATPSSHTAEYESASTATLSSQKRRERRWNKEKREENAYVVVETVKKQQMESWAAVETDPLSPESMHRKSRGGQQPGAGVKQSAATPGRKAAASAAKEAREALQEQRMMKADSRRETAASQVIPKP